MIKKFRKLLLLFTLLSGIVLIASAFINLYVFKFSSPHIFKDVKKIDPAYTAIILGAKVYKNGALSTYLADRVNAALELYQKGKVKRFLLSGDHGTSQYNEVGTMKNYLVQQGVSKKDIFMDHAGFNTYDTMARAKRIFQVKDAIIISQKYHLPRAVFIARKKGIDARGFSADRRKYRAIRKNKIREYLATVKSFGEVVLNIRPTFLGNEIPITGNSKLSFD